MRVDDYRPDSIQALSLEFRCEECIFDQVMRSETTAGSRPDYRRAVLSATALNTEPSLQMKGPLFYHQYHCWAKVEDTNFMQVLADIFKECRRVLKTNGRMVFTFHHWDSNAWAELTIALKDAGFRLMNVYVVFSENPVSVHINNLNAIKHDCILVLAPENQASHILWRSPKAITANDSEGFCRQCGEVLGWLLNSPKTPTEIRATWNHLITSRQNGNKKTSLEYPYAES